MISFDKRKGMELPIKIIIILVIMIVVLVIMVLWFGKSTAQGQGSTNCYMAFSDECGKFKLAGGCDDNSITASDYFKKSVGDNCYPSADAAKKACCSS